MARKKDPISQTRGILYGLAKLLGDISAVSTESAGGRIARRAAGKATGRTLEGCLRSKEAGQVSCSVFV